MDSILHTVITAVGGLIGTALVGLLVQLARKYGVELTATQHDLLVKVVDEGIAFAEEKVANGTVPPASKLVVATGYVTDRIGVTRGVADDVIHARLSDNAAGATVADPPVPPKIDPVSGRPV